MAVEQTASPDQVGKLPAEYGTSLVQPPRPVAGTLIVSGFDFGAIEDAVLRRDSENAARVMEGQNRVLAEAVVERGRLLSELRDRLKELKLWTAYVREVVGCSLTTADDAIRVYQAVGNRLATVATLDARTLNLLCSPSVDDETRKAILDDLDAYRIRPTLADVRGKLGRPDVVGGKPSEPDERLMSALSRCITATSRMDRALDEEYLSEGVAEHIKRCESKDERENVREDYRDLADAIRKGAK